MKETLHYMPRTEYEEAILENILEGNMSRRLLSRKEQLPQPSLQMAWKKAEYTAC